MTAADGKLITPLLDELRGALEDLLLTGLTTASKSTVQRLDVSFKEASRMRLLRLGSTLRIANEEISRFTTGSKQFSARRLAFFLGRAWLLATSMRRAIDANDLAGLDALMSTPTTQPVPLLKVVTLGVTKRVVPGAFASFDFRLRAIEAAAPVEAGEALIWSCVFPMRKDLQLPAEAFLHLPQKQKFKPSLLLEKKQVEITRSSINRQPDGATRLVLGETSEMKTGDRFDGWHTFWKWDLQKAAARLQQHRPTPFDLEIELQEEVFLENWKASEKTSNEEGYDLLPVEAGGLQLHARLDRGPSGTPLHSLMQKIAVQKRRPSLFGIVHYEACKLLFQPLTALGKAGPEYLTVSADKINQAELVKAMKFT